MKTAEAKPTSVATSQKANQPFFSKEAEGSFFGESVNEEPAFFKRVTANSINGRGVLQTKLTIGQPNDIYEKEADATADRVVQRLSESGVQRKSFLSNGFITPFVQKKCAHCEEEEKLQKKERDTVNGQISKKPIFESNERLKEEGPVQRKCAECEKEDKLQKKPDSTTETASPNIESNLSSSKGSGSPLPQNTRQQMESSFGVDFSDVRIHNDSSAVQMSRDINAQAFTHGNDIYFNSGKYDIGSNQGKHLLAHELTHTVQQNGSVKRKMIQKQDDATTGTTSGSVATPPVQTTVPSSMNCNPQGLSRRDFLSRNGNDVTEFGHTFITVDSSMLSPSFLTFQRVGRGRRIKPVAVSVILPTIDSIYTQAGVFIEGSRRVAFEADGDCLTDTYDLQWRISSDGADKIREGEQEHCDDYNYAYSHSVLLYVNEVNRLAAGSQTFASEDEARRFIRRRIGFEPGDWLSRFGCLLQQSLQRDRVTHGFTHSSHEPIPMTNAPNRYNHCRYATVTITARSLPQVGQTPSSTIITGC